MDIFKILAADGSLPDCEATTPADAIRLAKELANRHNAECRVYLMATAGDFKQMIGTFAPENASTDVDANL